MRRRGDVGGRSVTGIVQATALSPAKPAAKKVSGGYTATGEIRVLLPTISTAKVRCSRVARCVFVTRDSD